MYFLNFAFPGYLLHLGTLRHHSSNPSFFRPSSHPPFAEEKSFGGGGGRDEDGIEIAVRGENGQKRVEAKQTKVTQDQIWIRIRDQFKRSKS